MRSRTLLPITTPQRRLRLIIIIRSANRRFRLKVCVHEQESCLEPNQNQEPLALQWIILLRTTRWHVAVTARHCSNRESFTTTQPTTITRNTLVSRLAKEFKSQIINFSYKSYLPRSPRYHPSFPPYQPMTIPPPTTNKSSGRRRPTELLHPRVLQTRLPLARHRHTTTS